jgi:predicted metal-binding membrane protein
VTRGTVFTVGVIAVATAGAWLVLFGPLANQGMAMQMDVSVPLFMTAWVVMLLAMMLPALTPMVVTFRRITSGRGDGVTAVVVFVLGYLLVWTAAGLAPLLYNIELPGLRMSVGNAAWSVVVAAVLLAAGVYQLSLWKSACLRSCRAPLAFLMRHDFGTGPAAALRLGGLHGAICLGCCWALMALMVVAGSMSVAWMAGLAVIFLAEKAWSHGVALSRVLGAGSLGAAAVVAVTGWGIA